ncbi:MAG: MerR family transcriptional regulator [Clostridia bacterium]|nr:MerR family transcriptional regulator [Clostridia bacterium]
MNLICITDAVKLFGVSSKTLRYYESVGLIASVRPPFEKYRYYDMETIERLKQIMVLRKMKIPIKDIIRIYENADMSTVVEVFVNHINAIDEETNSLTELRRIVSEFLQNMMQNGITKISALPLLYEEMNKRLKIMDEPRPVSFQELSAVSQRLSKSIQPAIISLPRMRVLSSYRKGQAEVSEPDNFWRWIQQYGLDFGQPGEHRRFEYESVAGDVILVVIPYDFKNDSMYLDYVFEGGLFATINVYLDEDLAEQLRLLVSDLNNNKFYEVDYNRQGQLRHPVLLETLISPDDKRELVSMLLPVKKRLPDPALFDQPKECDQLSVEELKLANPTLWEKKVELDRLTPIKKAEGTIRYEVLPTGEVLFSTYVGTRYLSTNVQVKIPFRVDIEFKFNRSPDNADEGFRIYFGDWIFAVNEENNSDPVLSKYAIRFTQPIFGNTFRFPLRGKVEKGKYNQVSWIVGEKHLAVIINGKICLCLENMPYMKTNFQQLPPQTVMINGGGNMEFIVRKIMISQLETKIKNKKRRNGDLIMVTKQSNNQIEGIQTFCVGERGENFCFDGACEQLMRCMGEKDYSYWLIAGVSGDCYAQVYPKNRVFYGDRYCVADYHILHDDDCSSYIEGIFDALGYACTHVSKEKILANKEMYRQLMMAYIDKGIPVIHFDGNYSLICGYEENGKIFLQRRPCEDRIFRFELNDSHFAQIATRGCIFVGEKKEQKNLADIYRRAVNNMPEFMTTETQWYTFGAGAFRAWAKDIESDFYHNKTPEKIDLWDTHTSFVCAFETISAKAWLFLTKALELNPDMTFISKVLPIFCRADQYANNGLEDLGAGFNVTLAALQDEENQKAIAERLHLFAHNMDMVVKIIKDNL